MEKQPLNVYQRINAIMKDVRIIVKEKTTVNGQYRFVSHDAVVAEIRPLLVKYGVVVITDVVNHEWDNYKTTLELSLSFINIDNPTDLIITRSFGYGLDKQDKGIGKAYSYAFKYAMLKTFCLETGDDPERDNIDYKSSSEFTENVKKRSLASPSNISTLKKLFKETNTSDDKVYSFLEREKVKTLEELTNARVEKAIIALNKKLIIKA